MAASVKIELAKLSLGTVQVPAHSNSLLLGFDRGVDAGMYLWVMQHQAKIELRLKN